MTEEQPVEDKQPTLSPTVIELLREGLSHAQGQLNMSIEGIQKAEETINLCKQAYRELDAVQQWNIQEAHRLMAEVEHASHQAPSGPEVVFAK